MQGVKIDKNEVLVLLWSDGFACVAMIVPFRCQFDRMLIGVVILGQRPYFHHRDNLVVALSVGVIDLR